MFRGVRRVLGMAGSSGDRAADDPYNMRVVEVPWLYIMFLKIYVIVGILFSFASHVMQFKTV